VPIMMNDSLRWKTIKGAVITTSGYSIGQILRFVSNLILTRLLLPEFFGLMAIVNVFMIGLNMLSDIGLRPNIIQSSSSNNPDFLNTAWTIQIIRGVAIWIICLVLGYSMSIFYNEPLLKWLIPVAGISQLITGFASTNLITNNRDLNMFKLTLIDLGAQIITTLIIIFIALIKPTVWVFVFGTIIGSMVKMLASHYWLPGIRNRINWDFKIVKELFGFGKWIFISTVLSFASNSMGSLIMGKLVTMSEVGVFSIAVTLSKVVEGVYGQISQKILFPVYNKIKDYPIDEIRKRVRKIRLGVLLIFLPVLWILFLFGEEIVNLLFDDRYQGAGWILRIFSLGLMPVIISGIGPFYLALGNSKLMMIVSGVKFVSYISSMLIGWHFWQVTGVIIGMACYTIIVYFVNVAIQLSYKIWIPIIDLVGFLTSILIIGGALFFDKI